MENALLAESEVPLFSKISYKEIEPAIEQMLEKNQQKITQLVQQNDQYSWDNLVQPLENLSARLQDMWSTVQQLNQVTNTEQIRQAYNACVPKITAYYSELGQNEQLYLAYQSIANHADFKKLSTAKQKVISNALRDFHLSGVDLTPENKARFREIQKALAELTTKFEENILDATDSWTRLVIDERDLAGLPEYTKNAALEHAKKQQKLGWLLTLDFPCYYSVITYSDNPKLREEIYTAYVTRASELGPNAGKWDNTPIMLDILKLRLEEAKLLGFSNYAEVSIVPKMAKTTEDVNEFLNELSKRAFPVAKREWQELETFAQQDFKQKQLNPWDVAYFSEKLQKKKFQITQEELRPYFPLDNVLSGLFEIVNKLYGIDIRIRENFSEIWHPDVLFFDVFRANQLMGGFYLDLFARPQKRSGAWMDSCRVRHRFSNQQLQLPIVFLTCNFSAPQNDTPSLLTHDDVQTLFHEFGHGLHQLLTKVEHASVSGTSGVAWDAVELPSQFMENWCWQKESLDMISGHYQTGEKLPEKILQQLIDAKHFQAGMQLVRQLEFSLFDFTLHQETEIHTSLQIQKILNEIRHRIAVVPIAPFNRFQHSFSHIFGGGYAAGYYSYKWAEVLSSDVFTLFEHNGIFDVKTSRAFLENILEKGGSEDALDLVVAFLGREPKIDALLKQHGIE